MERTSGATAIQRRRVDRMRMRLRRAAPSHSQRHAAVRDLHDLEALMEASGQEEADLTGSQYLRNPKTLRDLHYPCGILRRVLLRVVVEPREDPAAAQHFAAEQTAQSPMIHQVLQPSRPVLG